MPLPLYVNCKPDMLTFRTLNMLKDYLNNYRTYLDIFSAKEHKLAMHFFSFWFSKNGKHWKKRVRITITFSKKIPGYLG